MTIKAVVLHPRDNIGVALANVEAGTHLDLMAGDRAVSVKLIEPIIYQHKFSITDIRNEEKIVKYGEVIGKATRDIKAGEHVHVHNMVGLRARARK